MSIKNQYKVFIDEMIKHLDEKRAYHVAYPQTTSPDAIRQGCYRLSQNVTVQRLIAEGRAKISALATQEAITELKEELKGEVLSAHRKRELLRQIAEGSIEVEVKKPVWNRQTNAFQVVTVKEVPDYAARLRAIEVDNKMSGDIAPTETRHTGAGGGPIETKQIGDVDYSQLPDDVLKAIINARKQNGQ